MAVLTLHRLADSVATILVQNIYTTLSNCYLSRSLVSAIGDAEAVICAVGAGSAFNGKAFDEVDRKVRGKEDSHQKC